MIDPEPPAVDICTAGCAKITASAQQGPTNAIADELDSCDDGGPSHCSAGADSGILH
jgi:hypothetical protein